MQAPPPTAPPETTARFESRHHPGDASAALVYARALTEPLAWSMTGVMIAAAASVLTEQDPLGWLLGVVPLVCLLVVGYTTYMLRLHPAELVLVGSRGVVRSAWEVATGTAARLRPVYSRKRTREGLSVALGRRIVTLDPEDWPDYDDLEAAVYAAAQQAEAERRARAAR